MMRLVVLVLSAVFLAVWPLASAQEAPTFAIRLKPILVDDSYTAIEVTESFAAPSDQERLIGELALARFNLPTAAAEISILDARDRRGRLRLSTRDVGEGDAARRQWIAHRAPRGIVMLRYRAPIASALAPRGPAPPIDLRNGERGISGVGAMFLLRPPSGSFRFGVEWDLPSGASAASSLDGSNETLPIDTLDSTFFMAGSIGRHANTLTHFGAAWHGEPPFDAPALMSWAERMRDYYSAFFALPPEPYSIFMRRNPVNPGGGIGLFRSFVLTFDQDSELAPLQSTLSHEMFHTYQPRISPEDGENPLSVSWFSEGLAVFYQREAPFRAGLMSAEDYLTDLNFHAGRYYTSTMATVPNSEVAASFWRDTRIRTLPYDRGFLYFATLDEAMRRHSNNQRSLDNLIVELRQIQAAGGDIKLREWAEMVQRELGEPGVEALRAHLAGAVQLPSSEAFGPCFRRVSAQMRRYELGFDPAVLTQSPRIVTGLIDGSAAQQAGLRNGDEITRPVGQDGIQGDQTGVLTLQIRRDGRDFELRYTPRGETVSAWQWVRVPNVPEETCRAAR